jgi:hypothetical protein
MHIFIKTLEGKYVFNVDPTITVASLKNQISETLQINKLQQRLIFLGSPMVDEYSLEKHKVEENSTINLLLTMM